MFLEIINCKKFCINIDCSIRESISAIEEGGFKIALVIDKEDNLIGTICDGDIRRALLKNLTIESPISKIIQKNCTIASHLSSKKEIYSLMRKNQISQVPILDNNGKLLGLEISNELSPSIKNKFGCALLMAGGEGKRLRPLTYKCPKPLLKIGGTQLVIGEKKTL